MGDLSAEPSMEDILSSIKRIIAEDSDATPPARGRGRATRATPARPAAAEEVLELSEPVESSAEPVSAEPSDSSPIVSRGAAQAARGKLDALSRMIVRPETTGSDTLEGLVRDMLRPMLAEWLDANLPGVVERIVTREVERITAELR